MENTNLWAPSPDHPGYTEKIVKKGNVTLHILRPELTDQERKKREAEIKVAAEAALREYYRKEEKR
jgi:hypothetical protein